MSNIKKIIKKNKENILIGILMLFVASIFLLQSPLHPLINGESGTDSSVFRLIGILMKKGYVPYRDTFDHKGPLLYIINYLGSLISINNGIWYIELLFLTLTLFTMYKIARLLCNKIIAILITFVSLLPLFDFFVSGNMSEEYALLFISISLFIYIDFLINKKVTRTRLLLCGVCLAAVLMLRPNMIGVWVVMSIAVLTELLVTKTYRLIWKFLTWFFLGILVVVVPIVFWMVFNDSLIAFINDYIIFNFKYTQSYSVAFFEQVKNIWYFIKSPTICISIVAVMIEALKTRNRFEYAYFICILINVLLICVGGRGYYHYGMILVPLTIYPLATIYKNTSKISNMDSFLMVIMIYLLVITAAQFINTIDSFLLNVNKKTYIMKEDSTLNIKNIVEKYTTENDPISVYGNWDYVYIDCNRMPTGKYSYQFPISNSDSKIMKEYFEDLYNYKPKVIIVQENWANDNIRIYKYLENNNYFETETNAPNARIFIRKY